MSLFTRWRTMAAPDPVLTWVPLHPEPVELSGDAADMDDDGQAFPFAYAVAFGLPGHPAGPVIGCCTYVVYGPPQEDTYMLGLRYTYRAEAMPGWSYTGWTSESSLGGAVSTELARAREDAAGWASHLITADRIYQISALPEVFGWDGTVF